MSQVNSFPNVTNVIELLKGSRKLDPKLKHRSLNPMLDKNDLNTDTFLNVYRRFTSRKCQPADLYSDNGKTFVGAKEELKRCLNDLDKEKIHKALEAKNTKWHFNPPYGPHFGSAWERLIQSVKRTLLIILGSRKFTFDVFHTIMVEAEAMMNSRPLTNVSDAMENEEPLTPSTSASLQLSSPWRLAREYLPTLIKRPKWTENDGNSLKVNDVVWILKDFTPRGIWPLGRVEEVFPGRDGNNRVVKVKTAYGTFVRPVSGLARVFSD
ncbi:uncharacterized protein LOC142342987 [Convolutriloba macropyga]|uniref:uncharacterized protein LOC142342987 n=1 Tax=Convolutriloba macropyga TaxID=536237 RepID=UPI003F51D6CF